MTEVQGVDLGVGRRRGECLVAHARGDVTVAAVAHLRAGLDKLLAEGRPVLLDVSGLRLSWAPAPELFMAAVTAAGGWPLAQLVLFGADEAVRDRLTACRVADSVPLADTETHAAALVGVRPARLARARSFPDEASAPRAARHFLREALSLWELPAHPDAEAVVTELATNAVRHAGTPFRLRLVLDDAGLRVSVRDRRPGVLPDVGGLDPRPSSGQGLRQVARRSRSWGVLHFADGKAVWAVLPQTSRTAGYVAAEVTPRTGRRAAPTDARSAAAATAPRRQRYTTGDPEQAHDFLRSLYGEHTLRLSAGDDFRGFQLQYDGRSTNRFTVERLSHTMPFEGAFAPAEALVVARPIAGDLHVATYDTARRAGPGDLVLVDAAAGTQVGWTWLDTEVVRLDPSAVALVAGELAGVDPAAVRFAGGRPVSPARAALWATTVAHLRDHVLPDDEVMASPLSRSTAFRHLVAVLLETFRTSALDLLAATAPHGHGQVAPAAIRRAVDFIEEHAGDDVTLADIAAAARLGPRGLQLAFRRHHDTTPLEYLRRVRLERAHLDLTAGNPVDDTVGAIAARWGFTHHGNFSATYLRSYGHSPGITLRA